jgi:Tripartite tricarboxylate transporter family receptor
LAEGLDPWKEVDLHKRLAALPDIPTISKQGIRGFAIDGWYGVVGLANLPTDVTATLNAGILKALADPDLVSRLKPEGKKLLRVILKHLAHFCAENSRSIHRACNQAMAASSRFLQRSNFDDIASAGADLRRPQ